MARWDIHQDLMGVPSYIAAVLLPISLLPSSPWYTLVAVVVTIVIFQPIHSAVFGSESQPRNRKNIPRIAAVLGGQVAFWAAVFFAVRSWHAS